MPLPTPTATPFTRRKTLPAPPGARWLLPLLLMGSCGLVTGQETGAGGSAGGSAGADSSGGSGTSGAALPGLPSSSDPVSMGGEGDDISGAPYSLSISQSISRDSNVLRAPKGLAEKDTISTTSLQLGIDQPFGRQRLRADLGVDFQRFRDHDEFNNTSPQGRVQLDWSAAERWEGELGARHRQQLFRDTSGTGTSLATDNIERTDDAFFRARVGVVTTWTFEGALSAYRRKYSAAAYDPSELERKSAELGVRYQPQPDLSLRTLLRYTDGRYPHPDNGGLGPDDFDRRDIEATLRVRPTGASTLHARLTRAQEKHQGTGRGDQKLWSGMVGWDWQPTAKLSFATRLVRDSDTGQSITATDTGSGTDPLPPTTLDLTNRDARTSTSASVAGRWRLSEKVQFGLRYQHTVRDLQRDLAGTEPLDAKDRLHRISLTADWTPRRWVGVGCSVSQEKRHTSGSTQLTTPYDASVAGCYASFRWQ